ncbi:MAG: hypothetical protein IKB16_05550 [Lentisphaeria bacterium]|nr:hypothetical protein [Lentisphaeria bacterium]
MKKTTGKKLVLALAILGGMVCADICAQTTAAMPAFFSRKKSDSKRAEAPTIVEAATMNIDMNNDKCTLLGNVIVDDQDAKITCDKMIIYLEDRPDAAKDKKKVDPKNKKKQTEDAAGGKQLVKVECIGEVVITRRADPKDPNAKEQVSTSDYALYDVKKEEMILTGRPVLTSGTDRLDCEKLIIHMDTGKVYVFMPVVTYYGDTQMPQQNSNKKK